MAYINKSCVTCRNYLPNKRISTFILGLEAGLNIDEFAPRLSFFWGIGMNFYLVGASRVP